MVEHVVVALIVAACACYAAWTLVPPLRRLFGQRDAGGACGGCDSCGDAPAKSGTSTPVEQKIHIVRTPPRR